MAHGNEREGDPQTWRVERSTEEEGEPDREHLQPADAGQDGLIRGGGEGKPPPVRRMGNPEEQARSIVANLINTPRGEAHLVDKPRHSTDSKFAPEGLGAGVVETGAAAAEEEERGVTQGD